MPITGSISRGIHTGVYSIMKIREDYVSSVKGLIHKGAL